MVLLVLYVKAELENIGSIKFPANLQYCFDVKDAQSDEEKKGVYLCADEIAEIDGSKGDANFVMRFPDCKKQCTVTFTDVKGVTREEYTEEDSGTFVPIRAFDCRGLELSNWTPNGGLVVRSKEGTVWEDVDLGADPPPPRTDGSSTARSRANPWGSPSSRSSLGNRSERDAERDAKRTIGD
jgi:hypothetical protein